MHTLRSKATFVVLGVVPGLLFVAIACSQSVASRPGPTAAPAAREPSQAAAPAQREADPVPQPTPTAGGSDARSALRTPSDPPPKVDTSIASVPLEEVLFDTFRSGFIPLPEATDEVIEALRDVLKPVYEPRCEPAAGGDCLEEDDLVVAYVSGSGEAFAYPIRMLNFHEMVNDVIDGVPVLVTYCPLCASGIVYSRELDGRVLVFGNTSALYRSDLVMYDHETGSYWFQVMGEAIVGPLTGKLLEPLPSVTTTWGQWRELPRDTKVLSRELGLGVSAGRYDRDPFLGYDDILNRRLGEVDGRLLPGDRVFAIQIGESHKAYALTGRPDAVINDEVGGARVVVIVRAQGPTGAVYLRDVDGRTLTFRAKGRSLEDGETGSLWDDGGRAVSGPMAGAQLTSVPSRTTFWFSLVGSLPGIEVHGP